MNPDACIWQSAQNILQAQTNLDKLFFAFNLIQRRDNGVAIEFDEIDKPADVFIQPAWNIYYRVKGNLRKNAKTAGWVTLAVQLTCDEGVEAQWDFGRRAKVLVGYSSFSDSESRWIFDTKSPNAAGYYKDCETNETHWTYHEGTLSWFYALPLDQMTSTADVRKYIMQPVHKILGGADRAGVLADISDALCLPPRP